ncbi:hypothetical protein [Calothrix sp. UHCC 0171]|uniref:hypothetical protein n=1 Tax=Calothrix sp. UHCC 0171 TaxID=3110245 RepID=UPI002B1EBA10|nr:hypothetical protein [Calothrix sp. UHCC 0171]MEA5572853.1 hypothetical protein [Calothrix sp. UHCC 0171]
MVWECDHADRVLGANHPNTMTIRGNLEYLRIQQQESGDNSWWQRLKRLFFG